MRRFLALIGGLILTFALLMVGARAIGATNPSPAVAILDPGNCPQPCWHGIQPGKTTFEQAKALLAMGKMEAVYNKASNFEWLEWDINPLNWHGIADNRKDGHSEFHILGKLGNLSLIRFGQPEEIYKQTAFSDELKIGDAIASFGSPSTYSYCYDSYYGYLYLFFPGNIRLETMGWHDTHEAIDADWVVTSISYNLIPEADYNTFPRWKGFSSQLTIHCDP